MNREVEFSSSMGTKNFMDWGRLNDGLVTFAVDEGN